MMAESVPAEIAELLGKLTSWGSWDREPVVAATLRELGQEALPGCLQALQNDGKVWGAIRALKESGTAVAPLLVAALEDRNATIRRNAAYALGRIGGSLSVESLIVALSDPDSAVRSAVARAIGELGHEAGPRSVEPLTNALTDREAPVRSAAAEALGRVGDARAVAALISCLFDDDINVRIHSSNALYSMADTAVPAIRAAGTEVIEALVGIEESEAIIYSSNGWLLKAVGEPAVRPLIAALRRCQGHEGFTYRRITGVLRSIGTPAALAVLPNCK
jgi:HEAT repeat protein